MYSDGRIERFVKSAEALGFSCTGHTTGAWSGVVEGKLGGIEFLFCPGYGSGCIDKPNGTRKWYSDKTDGQFLAVLKAVIRNNK